MVWAGLQVSLRLLAAPGQEDAGWRAYESGFTLRHPCISSGLLLNYAAYIASLGTGRIKGPCLLSPLSMSLESLEFVRKPRTNL